MVLEEKVSNGITQFYQGEIAGASSQRETTST